MSEPSPSPSSAGEPDSFVERQAHDVQRLLSIATSGVPVDEVRSTVPEHVAEGARAGDVVAPPFRVVVATDFASESLSATTVPLAVLTAFAQMFEAGAPVNLVFAVPHEADDADLLGAKSLLGQVATTRSLAGVCLESFDEVVALPTYSAVIPTGDPRALVAELATTLTAMHLLAETFVNPRRLRIALVHQHLLSRRRHDDEVAARLAAYREVHLP